MNDYEFDLKTANFTFYLLHQKQKHAPTFCEYFDSLEWAEMKKLLKIYCNTNDYKVFFVK